MRLLIIVILVLAGIFFLSVGIMFGVALGLIMAEEYKAGKKEKDNG